MSWFVIKLVGIYIISPVYVYVSFNANSLSKDQNMVYKSFPYVFASILNLFEESDSVMRVALSTLRYFRFLF